MASSIHRLRALGLPDGESQRPLTVALLPEMFGPILVGQVKELLTVEARILEEVVKVLGRKFKFVSLDQRYRFVPVNEAFSYLMRGVGSSSANTKLKQAEVVMETVGAVVKTGVL